MKETSTDSVTSFSSFGLHPDLLSSILAAGYSTPTPIQAQALPVVMQGRDVMGAAQTGTGKTAAFSLPILHRLMPFATHSASPARHPVRALILTPTRELADQVGESVKLYCKNTPLRSAIVFGGVDIHAQRDELRRGCEILIATPGRLLDHIEQKNVNLSQVGILVLDEADRMLDMGFLPDLDRIVRQLPPQRQSLLFSATFSPEIRKLGNNFLNNPVSIEVAARNATADTVQQSAYSAEGDEKRQAVMHIVRSKKLSQVIVFTNTKAGAARLARQLERDGIKAESIHGDKSQLERMKVLEAFKANQVEVLVATDVAARGLDVAGVPCVINFDLPFSAEDYVHRIGRTGRAGAKGEAIALVSAEEMHLWADIQKLTGKKLSLQRLSLPAAPARQREPQRRSYKAQDEIFYKPYQPGTDTAPRTQTAPQRSSAVGASQGKKRSVGILLGGGYY
ncbi:MAG TPA: DEAD/DEAH box helicase [Paenalcaligenes hominis]|uniref:DEAD-box ATP-dependent RNA helicase RhpA n=1 Tax=Paenalcaligenes hominis TaxID=643674 RepID=A0A9D2VH60_9BURK|nr:DEAD/DEAH box helicase [Paenalcaligenes hominis]NJB66255.1 ATP-dependent RNA helicase RhlE [Paenalcaligenes hominis]GGE74415.1 DEAD/DEAH box helicase [Paenalcaligenes hominis]HJH24835.1 DEAD/DEAH box helicase [Paenalcaligenes hominis]